MQKVWVDCDPGHDDALAIILAAFNPKLTLGLVTTVWGNQPLASTTKNALHVLQVAGVPASVPTIAGMDRAIVQQHLDHQRGHALGDEWGFHGTTFPPLTRTALVDAAESEWGSGIEAIRRWLEGQEDKSIVCVPTGCLTNIAVMFTVYPKLMHAKVKGISLMGGAIGLGNMSPAAEFNILADPEAARIVLGNSREDLPVTIVPLEVTHQVVVTEAITARIKSLGTEFADIVVSLLSCFNDAYREVFRFTEGPPMHDPCAVAYVAAPEIFKVERRYTEVVCGVDICAGRTVVDMYGMLAKGPRSREARAQHVYVATGIDVDAFWDMMLDALEVANANSPCGK